MTSGIYKITNQITRKAYIGSSSNIENRFINHKYSSKEMSDVIKKYGVDNFTFEVLEECCEDEFYEKEREYIKIYNTLIPNGYNKTPGGEHSFNTTGYYHVSRYNSNSKESIPSFRYWDSENNVKFGSISLRVLEQKVKCRGLKWKILDEKLASINLKNNDDYLKNIDYSYLKNNTGLFRVSRRHISKNNKTIIYRYSFTDEQGNKKEISSTNIYDLRYKVKSKKLPWVVLDQDTFEKAIKDYKNNNSRYYKSGIYRVSKQKRKSMKNNIIWIYRWRDKYGKRKSISSATLRGLEQKVKNKGLPWEVYDEEKFNKMLKEDEKITKTNNYLQSGVLNVINLGFLWEYQWEDDYGNIKRICSVYLNELEVKVKDKGLIWEIINEEQFKKRIDEEKILKQKRSPFGIVKVTKVKTKKMKKGFAWIYNHYDDKGNRKLISSATLQGLEQKVKSKGLPWEIIDENKVNEW